MMDQKIQEEKVDISNLMTLAEACCEESGKIHHDHELAIFESFPRKKRSRLEEFAAAAKPSKKNKIAAAVKPSKKKKKKNKRKRADVPNNSNINKKKKVKVEKPICIPAWVEELARTHSQINPQAAVWICDKLLTDSDAREGLNRFFIPKENSTNHLLPALTSQEQGMLSQGISVRGLDVRGELWNLELKYWPSIKMYVFQKEWFELLKKNNFEADEDTIQIWLCRHRGENEEQESLCFLIGKKGE